ncbi:MAG: hypothetical protein QOG87_766 [Actinomycetota bacterium]|jgi:HPt (histidine-containing phosphotransfer) domain-containing protein
MAAATAAAWVEAQPRIMARLAVLQDAAAAVVEGELDDAARREAEGEAHKLAGSLGMFGFPAGSELAHELEVMLDGEAPIGADFAELVARLAGVLPHS